MNSIFLRLLAVILSALVASLGAFNSQAVASGGPHDICENTLLPPLSGADAAAAIRKISASQIRSRKPRILLRTALGDSAKLWAYQAEQDLRADGVEIVGTGTAYESEFEYFTILVRLIDVAQRDAVAEVVERHHLLVRMPKRK